jgi:outer membrane protein
MIKGKEVTSVNKRLKSVTGILLLLGFLLWITPGAALGAESDDGSDNGTDDAAWDLTLDEAADRALAISKDLKLADYDIESNKESREAAADEVKYIPADGDNQEASDAFINLVQSDMTWQMSKKTKSIKEDAIVKSVFEAYVNVLTAGEKVALAEKELANAEFQRLAARENYRVGKLSLSDKHTAEASYAKKETALSESRVNLEDCYIKLNKLIGLNPEDRPILKDEPAFVPLEITNNLEAEVQRRLETNPDLWLAERNVETAELKLQLSSLGSSAAYRVAEINVSKSEVTASDNKETARQNLYSMYYSICQQEEQYKSQEQDLKQAEDTLRSNQLKYRLGMISKEEVLSAELDVANAQFALKSAAYQHELAKLSFDKPWA